MATSHNPQTSMLRQLASLMLSVAGESVGMMKRSAPEQALKLKPKDEWRIYLEFLKILFNLADRFSALHLPIKEQPQFMDHLEDAVGEQLKNAMAPALSAGSDPMEIVMAIGKVVSESRELYEPFRFVVTEENKDKEACFGVLADRVAEAMGTVGNGMVTSAAILCTSAAIPAMNALFEGHAADGPTAQETGPRASATQGAWGSTIKLISIMSSIHGEEVETRWGLHPRFRQDLSTKETKELAKLMDRVTQILGTRYATVAFSESWASWHHPGHA